MCGQNVIWIGNLRIRISGIIGDEAHHGFLRGLELQQLPLLGERSGFEIGKIRARGPEYVVWDAAFQQICNRLHVIGGRHGGENTHETEAIVQKGRGLCGVRGHIVILYCV